MSVYIQTIPDEISFSLPYSDNSGERIKVSLDKKKKKARVETIGDILVDIEDLDWLVQVLTDIKELTK